MGDTVSAANEAEEADDETDAPSTDHSQPANDDVMVERSG